MAKLKKDIIINGVTYKGIQLSEYNGRYDIDTAGISMVIRQFIKNNYGDIKNWVRSRSFAGGSAVDIYLWNVPNDWYSAIDSFANSFGLYNEYDGGDGVWRSRKVGATLTDGTPVSNYSPYMHVNNTPPWDAKEKDMTPPDYSKSLPKKSSGTKGYKKFGEKKTDGFEFVESCLNGWKLFVNFKWDEPKPYHYRLVKDYEVKPVGKEQFYALKGDMLEVGFAWSVKSQCFEMFSRKAISGETFSNACAVLRKYFPMTEEPKKEEATPPPTTTTTKVPIKSISLPFESAMYSSFKEVDDYFKFLYEDESKLPTDFYDKYKVEFEWVDGSRIVDRVDISKKKGDFNPFNESLSDYYKKLTDGEKEYIAFYEGDINTRLENLSFEDLGATQSEEINLEQLVNDMAILLDLEEDAVKRAELEQYISDLQILASLNN